MNDKVIVKSLFQNRELVVATMHGKEQVIAPVLEEALGVSIVLPGGFDTDQLGTFSGEIERTLSPIEAARKKCLLAAELTGATLAIASEGSFGPHPTLYFVPANEEILLLVDLKNKLEFKAKIISTSTNFSHAFCTNIDEVMSFAASVLFPSHALILKEQDKNFSKVVKGVHDLDTLEKEVKLFLDQYGQVNVETDMRAMCNPSRMNVIAETAKKLVNVINFQCPECDTPGFEVVEVKSGLPCGLCGAPTNSTLLYLRQCQKCHYTGEEKYPLGKQIEDPMYCNHCNP